MLDNIIEEVKEPEIPSHGHHIPELGTGHLDRPLDSSHHGHL